MKTTRVRKIRPGESREPRFRDGLVVRVCGAVTVLLLAVTLSLSVGAQSVPPGEVLGSLVDYDPVNVSHIIVRETRLPRTVTAILAGVALGVAGCTIQAMVRNPLADPGLLGVNSGAAFAVAVAAATLGVSSQSSLIWFALVGALAASGLVYSLGTLSPVRMLLIGTALTAVLTGLTAAATLLDPRAFDRMRYWAVGSVDGQGWAAIASVVPFVIGGLLLACVVAVSLNAVMLGDDVASSLGVNVVGVRLAGSIAVAVLAGAATAVAGPISFVGLLVPHVARLLVGVDQRRVLLFAVFFSPVVLILADVVGRIIVRPAEMPAGVTVAFFGAPLLVFLIRRSGVKL
ncbi:iron ABC transporter permease [Corynebacterium sp. P7202]|uniref:Iron chelate uptake ABC transporter family permease subunit n=1 Tax=Corynebacterium pygosceleis TaxID=2800406 RepID=A0A9Q4C7V5_9CORY|nr:iron chelate uptake ABC transporter family permease subunit [Corynebacterium pygosceleis]MCK7637481.1 iron ABC transporter permease [Corynebacterium pygosceleis]MCX7444990.1 iron chelate uptake ABC transporter family permease subunit [Corynebacterium pygosceleis]MCX7468190.1 iron chelate uptake ABC transporter family permease subunit [Corynebacterium pygosceleis]